MNADGSGQVALTTGPDLSNLPAWSADGSKIVFVRGQPSNWHIWVMNADGSGQTRLSYAGNEETFPDWSPDGSKIVWESDHTIRVMNSDGTGVVTLTPGNTPAWSPDGAKIVFGSSPANDLLVMNPDGTEIAHIPNSSASGSGGYSTHPD